MLLPEVLLEYTEEAEEPEPAAPSVLTADAAAAAAAAASLAPKYAATDAVMLSPAPALMPLLCQKWASPPTMHAVLPALEMATVPTWLVCTSNRTSVGGRDAGERMLGVAPEVKDTAMPLPPKARPEVVPAATAPPAVIPAGPTTPFSNRACTTFGSPRRSQYRLVNTPEEPWDGTPRAPAAAMVAAMYASYAGRAVELEASNKLLVWLLPVGGRLRPPSTPLPDTATLMSPEYSPLGW